MKAVYKYSIAALTLIMLVSCNNEILEGETDMTVPENGYIFFNTDVDSRGVLIEDRLEANFGVMGYHYAGESNWNTAKALATPNVFDTYNQQVIWENNLHKYTPQKPWIAGQKYSFFAYYPYGLDNLTPSLASHEGNPYVEYTLASRSDATKLVDVMTSQVIDTDASARTVDFVMKHRLTAVDVVARNFNEPYDPNTNIQGDEKEVYVKITDMKITFSNLLFDKVRIPLNTEDEPDLVYTAKSTTPAAEYTLLGGDISIDNIAPARGNESEFTPITSSEQNTSMIVIPQQGPIDFNTEDKVIDVTEEDCHLNCRIDFTYDYVDQNVNSLGLVENTSIFRELTVDKGLQSGRRYYIQLTFTRGAITIGFIESQEWADKRIDHEFE